ncbi:hypothetical protein ANANG_G00228430 [Anguilla anguilla]|uniref:PSI domain-containing protein n=1 Tax=Anguilla anguilla TaxID=7936 RepID=A0A9D3RQV8_ANGAN|nr:hypothetical protein ANANG_G00228430 [Anguilla anguilla]
MPAAAPLLLLLAIWWWPLVLLLLLPPLPLARPAGQGPRPATRPAYTVPPDPLTVTPTAPLSHLLLDPATGHVYVGRELPPPPLPGPAARLLGRTGPNWTARLPAPIDPRDCTQARRPTTPTRSCCWWRGGARRRRRRGGGGRGGGPPAPGRVRDGPAGHLREAQPGERVPVLYRTENPVDTQYVAANDPRVSTELGKLVVGSYSEYNNNFVARCGTARTSTSCSAARRARHAGLPHLRVAAVRGRRQLLLARGGAAGLPGGHNLAQAAALGQLRGAPPVRGHGDGAGVHAGARARSRRCARTAWRSWTARSVAQLLCYTQEGRSAQGQEEAYIEYEVSSACLRLSQNVLNEYPCGGSTPRAPSPAPSPFGRAILTWNEQLTAVASANEVGHTVVLLGDRRGQLHKVFLKPDGNGSLYETVLVDKDSPVNADLLLDATGQSVYVMTRSRVTKVPVSQCGRHLDCDSCLSAWDPFCGWCVLEGRCTRKLECSRQARANHWLWSYRHGNKCVTVESLSPAVQSREERTQVSLTVVQLPSLSEEEALTCSFGDLRDQPAVVKETSIVCQSPLPEDLPQSPPGTDHVTLPVALMFGEVIISQANMTFYDCRAAGQLNKTSP